LFTERRKRETWVQARKGGEKMAGDRRRERQTVKEWCCGKGRRRGKARLDWTTATVRRVLGGEKERVRKKKVNKSGFQRHTEREEGKISPRIHRNLLGGGKLGKT